MEIIHKIENLVLDILLSNLDQLTLDNIIFDRINCLKKINTCFPNTTVTYLLENINLENLPNNKYQKLYDNCIKLLDNNNYEKLEKVFDIIDKMNLHPLYYYFFSKIQIKYKLNLFNETPLCEDIIYEYPNRIYINNIFDLEQDIDNLIKFISLVSCNNKKVCYKNVTNEAIRYHYFFKLVIYNINITKKTREKYKNILNNIYDIEKKINDSIKYNIPLKIKSGFII